MTRKFLLPLGGLAVVVASGVVHGMWTGRWVSNLELDRAAARVVQLPLDLGEWHGKDVEADSRALGPLKAYFCRRYVNQRTGVAVTLSLAAGEPGPVSIHTPDVCYVASGFEPFGQRRFTPTIESLPNPAEFLTAQFVRKGADPKTLRVFWSWNAGGVWQVSDTPRFAFAPGYRVLYKLHLVRESSGPEEPLEDDPCVGLLRQFLPEFQRLVISAS